MRTVVPPATPLFDSARRSAHAVGPLLTPPPEVTWNRRATFGRLMKRNAQTIALGAHRGMGKNVLDDGLCATSSRSWRENTIKSFLKAVEHGASFIEFDVQVTRDGVPVVFHDDSILFGTNEHRQSAQIRDLRFEEFRSISQHHLRDQAHFRTLLFRESGAALKAWTCEDEDELPSLEQVFHSLPEHVGFNIEVKTSAPTDAEIERISRAILNVVHQFKGDRTVVFSSFDPDLVKRLKCDLSHPTMFLSEGDSGSHVDPRRTSFAAAIEWARCNQLDGIVLHSNSLRRQQDVIQQACALGLIVMTYGTENDDHDWVLSQFCLGVHGAIVDDVAGIAQKLSASRF